MKLISYLVTPLVALGVAYGVAIWMGDGAPIFSQDWFTTTRGKITTMQDDTRDQVEQNLPKPEEMNLPNIGNAVEEGTRQ